MSRIAKWVVALLVIGVAVYLALVGITGSKAREVASEQFQTYASQSPDVDVEIEWTETGFWSSEGLVTVQMDVEPLGNLVITHTMRLRHGALGAAVAGELEASLGGESINARMLNGEPIILDGRVGLGGARLSYQVPAIEMADEASDIVLMAAPFALDVVLTDDEQHSQTRIEWLRVTPTEQSHAKEGVYVEGLHFSAQTRLDPDDGELLLSTGESGIEYAAFNNADDQAQMSLRQLVNEIRAERVGDSLQFESDLSVEEIDYMGFMADLELDFVVENIPFAAFQQFQQNADQEGADFALLEATRQNGGKLILKQLQTTITDFGRVEANGEFWLREGFPRTEDAEFGDYLNGQMNVLDLPQMLMMPLSGVISGELPWLIELEDGELSINGEALDLPAH